LRALPDLDAQRNPSPTTERRTPIVGAWFPSNLSLAARLDVTAEIPGGPERIHEWSVREIADLTAEVRYLLMEELVDEFCCSG
jgi:hypothetical protein